MTRKGILILILFELIFSSTSWAYTNLRVLDPRSSWHNAQGTIEEAVISVKPQGIFMEIGVYLTFSAKGWNYSSSDSLEVEFNFDLPENAVVYDSWLWIGNDIIRGEIMDKWTAAAIYEDIVKRRRDPSILYKRSSTHYELHIFPMLASETRKMKLTYLVPTQWSADLVMASLPTNLLQASRYIIPTFYVLNWLTTPWKNPKILEFPDIAFAQLFDENLGTYWRADLPSEAIYNTINFTLDAPMNDGIYVSRFQHGSEAIYQLAFLPSQAVDISSYKKVAVLFDYDATKSEIGAQEILTRVKSTLHTSFAEKDSFNLIFSKLNILRASDTWLPCDSAVIEQSFAGLGQSPISNYSNLPSLLSNGISFVQENGNDGSLLLLSNSDQVGDFEVANQLIEDILAVMDPKIPLHIADFTEMNYSYHWIGGRYYYGNEYFYTNISRLTSANYFNIRSGYTFNQLIINTFNSLSGFIGSFDLHTRLQIGPCYSRFNLGDQQHAVYLDRPILQIGKFQGDLPLMIDVSGIYGSEIFSRQYVLEEQEIQEADSLSVEAWTGQYINYLESLPQTNDVVGEIVDYSINERVLSIYSAFLCLEPSRGGQICYDCVDESGLVGIEDPMISAGEDTLFTAYPNPFNNEVKIIVTLPGHEQLAKASFRIYNILGQVVRTFNPDLSGQGSKQHFIWYGKNDAGLEVASGTYFFIVNTPEKRFTLKLLLMK